MITATTDKTQGTDDTTTTVTLDTKGLKAAARFLERQGYDIIERDWKCKFGTMDLIVSNEDELVFVEVKTRSNKDHGLPEDAITDDKRAVYEKIAIAYLATVDVSDVAVRFDVVSILVVSEDRAFLRHHVNALAIGE